MDVKLKGENKVRLKLKNISKSLASKELMNEIGNFLLTSIKIRTAKGKDVKGKKFKAYSASYKFFRDKKKLPTNIVDLFFTGSMLSSMTFKDTKEEVKLFFMPTTDKKGMSNPEKAFYVDQKRNFFSISADESKKIIEIAEDHIRKSV